LDQPSLVLGSPALARSLLFETDGAGDHFGPRIGRVRRGAQRSCGCVGCVSLVEPATQGR